MNEDEGTITSGDIAAAVEETTKPAAASPAPQTSAPAEKTETAPTEPAAPAEPAKQTSTREPVPYDRFETVTRQKQQHEERLAQLAWAQRYDPQAVERAMQLAELYEKSPDQLHAHLNERLRLAEAPQPDLQTEDGRRLYSDAQAAALVRYEVSRAVETLERKFDERFGPIEQRERTAVAWSNSEQIVEKASQEWPGFTEHIEAITDRLAEARAAGKRLSLHEAYIHVVVPTLASSRESIRETERRAILAELNQTSERAADVVNPQRKPSPRVVPDEDRPLAELLEEEMMRRSA